jgi:hypothetical protein
MLQTYFVTNMPGRQDLLDFPGGETESKGSLSLQFLKREVLFCKFWPKKRSLTLVKLPYLRALFTTD